MCVGQPLLIAGDLNAVPGVIPCLAQGISSCKFVDLALAYSLGRKPDALSMVFICPACTLLWAAGSHANCEAPTPC